MGWSVPHTRFDNIAEVVAYALRTVSPKYNIVDHYIHAVPQNENADHSTLFILCSPENEPKKVEFFSILLDWGVDGKCGFKHLGRDDTFCCDEVPLWFIQKITEISLEESTEWINCLKEKVKREKNIKKATKYFWDALTLGDKQVTNSGYNAEYIGSMEGKPYFKILELNGSSEHKFYGRGCKFSVSDFSNHICENLEKILDEIKKSEKLVKNIGIGTKIKLTTGMIVKCLNLHKGKKFTCEIVDCGDQDENKVGIGDVFLFKFGHFAKASLIH